MQTLRCRGILGPCPPKSLLVLPKRELCCPQMRLVPDEIYRLGATVVQFDAKILVITLEFVSKNCLFVDFFWSSAQNSKNLGWKLSSVGPHSWIQINKVFVPPKILFIPPQSRYPGAGLERVSSSPGPSLHHCARAKQILLKKCYSGGKPLATLFSIWPAQLWTSNLTLRRRTRYHLTNWPLQMIWIPVNIPLHQNKLFTKM